MVNILIVDDHPIVRKGLIKILSDSPEISNIDEVKDGIELFNAVGKNSYDIILLDITLPGKNGLELLKELRENFPAIPVLVLSVHSIDKYAIEAVRLGAAGYLTKSSAPSELKNAIHQIRTRGKYISEQLAEKMLSDIDRVNSGDAPRHSILSKRELEVLKLIGDGKRVKEISEELKINVKTVSTYRERILQKMNFSSNADMVRYAIKEKLIE